MSHRMEDDDEEEEEEEEDDDEGLENFLSSTEGSNPVVRAINSVATRVGSLILRWAPALGPVIPSSGIYGSDDEEDMDSVVEEESEDENWRENLGTGGIKHPEWLSSDSLGFNARRRSIDVLSVVSMFNYDHVQRDEEEGEETDDEEMGPPKLGPRRLSLLPKLHLTSQFRSKAQRPEVMQMRTCLLRTVVGGIHSAGIDRATLTFEFWQATGCKLMHRKKLKIRNGMIEGPRCMGLTIFSYLSDLPSSKRVQEWTLFAALGKERVLESLIDPISAARSKNVDRWYFNAHGNKKFHKTSFLAHWLSMNQCMLFEDRITRLPLYKVRNDPDAVCIPHVACRHVATVLQERVFSRLPIVTPASVSVRVSRVRVTKGDQKRRAISFNLSNDVLRVPEELDPIEMVKPIEEKPQ